MQTIQQQQQLLELTLPQRPGLSKSFNEKTITLESNIFSLSLAPQQLPIRLYDIKIFDDDRSEQIPSDARIQRQEIIKEAAPQLKKLFSNNFWYSGEQLWSTNNFPQPKTIEVKLGRAHYSIILTKAKKEINLKPETFRDSKLAPLAYQYLNILIKRFLKEKDYKEWGMNSKYYDPNRFYHIDQYGLDVYTGFKTSCQVYQGFLPRVLIDFSSKILRSDSALSYIQKARDNYEVERLLVGKSVVTSYGNYRMWRVDSVDFKRTPGKEKAMINGKQVRLVEYYMEKYNIKIQNLNQPLLVNFDRRTRRETLLVPELVQMTGLDDRMRNDFRIMKEVATYTRLEPKQRMEEIQSLNKPLAEFFAKEYNITMEKQSSVQGHVLTPPKLLLGNKKTIVPEKNGNYTLKDTLYMPANIENWLFIFAEESTNEAYDFIDILQQCSKTFGVKVAKPKMVPLAYSTDRNGENLKKTIRTKVEKETQIVVCMSPTKNGHWYKPCKDVACKELGLITQFFAAKSLAKNPISVVGNILKQMNIKLGKELWLTERPKELPAKTMIIGADVFHSTKIGHQKKSCIGFCASLNDDFSQYFSKATFQNRIGQEIMTNIGLLVKEALQKYYDFGGRKHYPECIIFYRDGVGENQIDACLEIETSKILEELKAVYKDSQFKFAEIIVTKRIDDRLFVQNKKDYSNPPAGTVVGQSIVSNNFDFLMVSQNVNQGTCTPTHYQVIFDNTGFTEDVFWKLTYTQCYNYYNWNGGVRVPAAAQYAHKLAYLMGQTVQGEAHKCLDQYLYYL